jgi:hypothetical protein
MNFKLLLAFFILFQSSSFKLFEINNNCVRIEKLGKSNICIPFIEGMNECYQIPIVKEKADKFDLAGNIILGIYLNNSTFKMVSSINEVPFDDYIKVFCPKSLAEMELDYDDFKQLSKILSTNYIVSKWSDIQEEIETKLDDFEIKNPVIIDQSTINNNINNQIILTTINNGVYKSLLICSMNFIYIKNKVVCLCYYKTYENKDSITKLKIKNNVFVNRFYELNKS